MENFCFIWINSEIVFTRVPSRNFGNRLVGEEAGFLGCTKTGRMDLWFIQGMLLEDTG